MGCAPKEVPYWIGANRPELAKQYGVKTSDDLMNLARLGEAADIIIDVTGVAKVRGDLRRYMQNSKNQHAIIMHERMA